MFINDDIIKHWKSIPWVAIFFVYISLAMVTSSKTNVESSTKAWYVDETDSYHIVLIGYVLRKLNHAI